MCIEFGLKKGGIGILKNFMYSTKSVYRFLNKRSPRSGSEKVQDWIQDQKIQQRKIGQEQNTLC